MSAGTAATLTIVKPASARLETLVILAVIAFLIAATVLFARVNAREEQNAFIADWQVSAFHGLSPVDQANYNALVYAGSIIQTWYDDSYAQNDPHWATVEELSDDEAGLEPFIRDISWKQRGELQWRLITSYAIDGVTVYFGNGGKVPGQSAYLLVVSHLHKGASYTNQAIVWIHRNAQATAPETVNVDSLVRNGWKQVVLYSGADEVKRLRGTG
jgi:hypothetical protein